MGIDWISATGDFEPNTGLQITTLPGTAYGFDLYEKYGGNGIGYSLLLWSLQMCRERGFKRQVTIVSANNMRMLTVAKKLIGYEEIGTIRTRKVLRRPQSHWAIGAREGRGGIISV